MFKKFVVFTFTIIFLSNVLLIKAQTNSDRKIAKLKYTLTDFRNPSNLRNRFGLLQFSPDGNLLAVSGTDRDIVIYNAETGQPTATVESKKVGLGKLGFNAFSFSPDGKMLVTASNNQVKIWSDSGKLLQTLENAVFPARFSADGRLLATGGKNDTGYVWQIEENRRK